MATHSSTLGQLLKADLKYGRCGKRKPHFRRDRVMRRLLRLQGEAALRRILY